MKEYYVIVEHVDGIYDKFGPVDMIRFDTLDKAQAYLQKFQAEQEEDFLNLFPLKAKIIEGKPV